MPHRPPTEPWEQAYCEKGREQTELPPGVASHEGVPFGTGGGRPLTLDLYTRAKPGAAPRPAMLFIHGGGWQGGTPKQFRNQAAYLAWKYDFFCACISYRLSDEAPFPAALEDSKCGMRWLRAQATTRNLDAKRIGVTGGSAGGHLSAMIAATATRTEWEGDGGHAESPSHADAAILFNPALNLADDSTNRRCAPQREKFVGTTFAECPERFHDASPISHAGAHMPPTLLIHGEGDETVHCEQSRAMHAKLVEAKVPTKVVTYPDQPHGWFNAAPHCWETLMEMEAFLAEHFKLK